MTFEIPVKNAATNKIKEVKNKSLENLLLKYIIVILQTLFKEECLIIKKSKCGHIKLQNDFSKQSYR